ncbi:hypothetical protein [Neisseria zalophi]|uniref:Uncharacterized protein n=1 Tax=Neisseria zalophi TaxID=640030 RepID=A0A5J6PUD1_9NEIS|nr:hypothetical protein [Neisseria zalophi]QEY26269.1 hypothetical protein D0T92_06845 [Neisseria zalophi]
MKKTVLTFAALATLAASFASAKGAHMPKYDHANDSGPIPGLQEVHYEGMRRAAKNDDRVKFIAPRGETSDAVFQYHYNHLGRTERRN